MQDVLYRMHKIKNYPQIEVFEEGDPNFKEENLVLVSTAKDDKLGLNYTETIPVLLKAIQELSAKVDALETENTAIKARLDALEAE